MLSFSIYAKLKFNDIQNWTQC